jgi:hypothetical protein
MSDLSKEDLRTFGDLKTSIEDRAQAYLNATESEETQISRVGIEGESVTIRYYYRGGTTPEWTSVEWDDFLDF